MNKKLTGCSHTKDLDSLLFFKLHFREITEWRLCFPDKTVVSERQCSKLMCGNHSIREMAPRTRQSIRNAPNQLASRACAQLLCLMYHRLGDPIFFPEDPHDGITPNIIDSIPQHLIA